MVNKKTKYLFFKISLPLSTLVPAKRTTNGTCNEKTNDKQRNSFYVDLIKLKILVSMLEQLEWRERQA